MSLRLPADLRAVVAALAPEHGGKPHSAVIHLIRLGAESITPPVSPAPKEVLAQAEAKAAHLALPKRRRRAWSLKSVPLGPVDSPLGSRLKGITPGKAKK